MMTRSFITPMSFASHNIRIVSFTGLYEGQSFDVRPERVGNSFVCHVRVVLYLFLVWSTLCLFVFNQFLLPLSSRLFVQDDYAGEA